MLLCHLARFICFTHGASPPALPPCPPPPPTPRPRRHHFWEQRLGWARKNAFHAVVLSNGNLVVSQGESPMHPAAKNCIWAAFGCPGTGSMMEWKLVWMSFRCKAENVWCKVSAVAAAAAAACCVVLCSFMRGWGDFGGSAVGLACSRFHCCRCCSQRRA